MLILKLSPPTGSGAAVSRMHETFISGSNINFQKSLADILAASSNEQNAVYTFQYIFVVRIHILAVNCGEALNQLMFVRVI